MHAPSRLLSCDVLHDRRTYTALTLSQCYDSVHRLDLERELGDRDPPGKVGRVTFDDTSHAQIKTSAKESSRRLPRLKPPVAAAGGLLLLYSFFRTTHSCMNVPKQAHYACMCVCKSAQLKAAHAARVAIYQHLRKVHRGFDGDVVVVHTYLAMSQLRIYIFLSLSLSTCI
jgi:hypothetical protein